MSETIKAFGKRRLSKEQMLQLITGLLVLAALVALASNVVQRHLFAQNMLDEITPRYERLLGIEASAKDMQGLTQRSNQLLQAYAYPASREPSQIGTDIQQKLRTAFAGQSMSIQSSQVLPEEEDGALMAVPVELRIEGNIQGLRNALAVLSSQRPLIQLREITLQKGRKLNVNTPVLLTIQAKFFAWRERP
ncbi:hypothetical protein E8K88_01820 [Lampropedia aestuarii]|uniref:General secretion pathway protein GspM n=1 Tax=Lampropedia aestuarii TaxID=2562762 RepID=A0A4S5C0Y1_9BURK|nr:GspMb/PilO family protein [Lampropedia aestuarii]MDH5857678.1 GspMb/PilO family protein [Lampropedia aestuarii]THJ36036.1 hypothetical protein E8K88_01820 [Lampropedia aestuarii]